MNGTPRSYAELVRTLFPRLTGGIRWGTERTERMLASLGDPHRRFASIHVGGTNGKGSVAANIATILEADGRRVGLYTSPHLCCFRERIRIDGQPIPEADLLRIAEAAWPAVQREAPSFFEATTVIAFEAFARADIEVAVIEVGLGGRLDATNVISPAVVALTNVERDHTDLLGDTLEQIAGEKAGIIKPGAAVVTAEQRPELRALFEGRAQAAAVPILCLEPEEVAEILLDSGGTQFNIDSPRWGLLQLRTPLCGRHQAWNAGLAVRAVEMLPPELRPARESVVRGVAAVDWPGRFQRETIDGADWIFDVAHNPAGVRTLLATLQDTAPAKPVTVLAAVLSDKDWPLMLEALAKSADRMVLTCAPTAPENRRWDPELAAERVRAMAPSVAVTSVPDFGQALARVRGRVEGGTVLVTGSFHTVGNALAALGRAPQPADAYLPPLPSAV